MKYRQGFLQFVILGLAAFCLLPFLVNALYCYPATDDFYISSLARDEGFFQALHYHYTHFNGRFASISLLFLNPLAYDWVGGYKLAPWLLSLILGLAFISCVGAVSGAGFTRKSRVLFAFAVLWAFFDQMPDIRPGLYWLSATVTYQIGGALFLLYFSGLLTQLQRQENSGILAKVGVVVIAGILPGFNELLMLITLSVTGALVLWFYSQEKRLPVWIVVLLGSVVVGSAFLLLAPGNSLRMANYSLERNLWDAAILSCNAAFSQITTWMTTPAVLCLSVATFFGMRNRGGSLHPLFQSVHPLLLLGFLLLGLMACFFLPIWATGHYPDRRVLNLIFLLFLSGWLIHVACWGSYTAHLPFPAFAKRTRWLSGFLGVLFLGGLLMLGHSNWWLVVNDLTSGRSAGFAQEQRHRYNLIYRSKKADLEVPPLRTLPRSLFFSDIRQSSDNWINQSYARFFRMRSVVVLPPEPKSLGSVQDQKDSP